MIYNPKSNHSNKKVPPKIYEIGRKLRVCGVTNSGDYYDVKFLGENPLYNPSKFGETEKSLLDKVGEASEQSIKNVRDRGGKQGVLVVDDSFFVTPIHGVEVINIRKRALQI